jgi:site-specific DNA-methyltransferase (adenine-specific)
MNLYFSKEKINLYHGNCLEILPQLPENSIDSIATDSPYGLGMLGANWDHDVPSLHFWKEMLRVAKPGSYLLSFGGTRTYHRLVCAIEDAGWEIKDCLMWLYGGGFPKGLNISKQFDDSELSNQFSGYASTLKPAYEPIILAMKPLDGTYSQNAEKWGIAGLNIDECRIEIKQNDGQNFRFIKGQANVFRFDNSNKERLDDKNREFTGSHPNGRWPANVLLDEKAAAQLDEQTGILTSGKVKSEYMKNTSTQNSQGGYEGKHGFKDCPLTGFGDSGGASRFFYVNKVVKSEKDSFNNHPTVKPIGLMNYLCKLIRPPKGGILLDPFMGSGTTGVAALQNGMSFVGIEQEEKYIQIAVKRIDEKRRQLDAEWISEY